MRYFLIILVAGFFVMPLLLIVIGIQAILRICFPQQIRVLSNLTISWLCRYLLFCAKTTVRVQGLENIPEGGCIFMSNHQSAIDIVIIYGYIPKPLAMIAKKSLKHIPFVGWYMQNLGCYLIDRKNPAQVKKVFESASRIIHKNRYSVLIYPEGRRSRCESMGPLRPGSMRLPLMAQCPIVPITISGSWKLIYCCYKPGRKFVDLVVHPPILTNQYTLVQREDLITKVESTMRSGFTKENK